MPISRSRTRPVIAVTCGDPSGIGPEVSLKAAASKRTRDIADLILICDAAILARTAVLLGRNFTKKHKVKVLDINNVPKRSFSFGKVSSIYGRASIEYVDAGYGLVESGVADALVTAPINKASVKRAGFAFPGHTEYLASLAGAKRYAMMLVGGPLKVTLVTRHIPIRSVSSKLTVARVTEAIRLTLKALKHDFMIMSPKVAVCGLNPHSGDGGAIGSEEKEMLVPAVKRFKREGVSGPMPADAIFYDAYRGRYDAVVCIYHDQGLIPLKMVARDVGVNTTLGIGFTRTSPDHGTAFDIAGKGIADPSSMQEAIKLAVTMAAGKRR